MKENLDFKLVETSETIAEEVEKGTTLEGLRNILRSFGISFPSFRLWSEAKTFLHSLPQDTLMRVYIKSVTSHKLHDIYLNYSLNRIKNIFDIAGVHYSDKKWKGDIFYEFISSFDLKTSWDLLRTIKWIIPITDTSFIVKDDVMESAKRLGFRDSWSSRTSWGDLTQWLFALDDSSLARIAKDLLISSILHHTRNMKLLKTFLERLFNVADPFETPEEVRSIITKKIDFKDLVFITSNKMFPTLIEILQTYDECLREEGLDRISQKTEIRELSVFISYAIEDIQHIPLSDIVSKLESPPIYKVYFWTGKEGDIRDFIVEGISKSDYFIPICTKQWNKSPNCKKELKIAFTINKDSIPLFEDLSQVPIDLRPYTGVNLLKKSAAEIVKEIKEQIANREKSKE